MPQYIGVGLMSGSSLDGLDLAAARLSFDGDRLAIEPIACHTEPWSEEWRDRLQRLPDGSAADLAKTHVDFGHLCGLTLRRFLLTHEVQPDFIASHGHTIFHQPHRHFTTQIGCGQTLASYVGCPVVNDFRPRDLAQGGEGAPLVPFAELFAFPEQRLFLNLGGIANLSILQRPDESPWPVVSRLRKPPRQLACDICPFNQVLDRLARLHDTGLSFDPEGSIARTGHVVPELLQQLQGLPFYAMLPPRSLGREWMEAEVWPLIDQCDAPAADLLRTWVEHAALQVAAETQRQGLRNAAILTTGGGARNAFFIERLQEMLRPSGLQVLLPAPLWIDYKEALLFAFLGLCTLQGRVNVLHEATGARQASVLGAVHLPEGCGLQGFA